MQFEYPSGATPLDPDEIDGLIPLHITTLGQLNEWEAENWLFSAANLENFLTIDFIRLLHKKMLGNTWRWAGTFRNTAKNIGVDASKITSEALSRAVKSNRIKSRSLAAEIFNRRSLLSIKSKLVMKPPSRTKIFGEPSPDYIDPMRLRFPPFSAILKM